MGALFGSILASGDNASQPSAVIVSLFMTNFYMSPCSSDYIIPFGSGARGWIILSSPASRCTFHSPGLVGLHLWLGSGLSQFFEMFPEFTRFSSCTFIKTQVGPV